MSDIEAKTGVFQMKKLFLLIAIFLIGCSYHAKPVSFILANYSNSTSRTKAYLVEGKLINSWDPVSWKGIIYDLKIIRECPPCNEKNEYLMEYGFYNISIDSMTGGSWYLPAYIFSTANNNYATPYQLGLPKDAMESLKAKFEVK